MCTTLKQDAISVANKLHLHSPWKLAPGDPTIFIPTPGKLTWVAQAPHTSTIATWWSSQPNARSERFLELYSKTTPLVIPSTAFQERLVNGMTGFFSLPYDEPFMIGAVAWTDPEHRTPPMFSLLTTNEGGFMFTQHGRQPVIFVGQQYEKYLSEPSSELRFRLLRESYRGPFEWTGREKGRGL